MSPSFNFIVILFKMLEGSVNKKESEAQLNLYRLLRLQNR